MPTKKINGQELFYEDSGGEDKPALVFMHGFLFDQSMFDPQVEVLKDDYRCIRFDARAMGQTGWDGEPFNLYDTVADCIGLVDALGIDKFTVIGMSQGGYAALRVALRHQDRLDGLILMSTTHNIDDEDFKTSYRSVRDAWKANDAPPPTILENMLKLFVGDKGTYQHLWEVWQPKFAAIKGDQVYHGMNNLLERDELTLKMLQKIKIPSLVIHGTEDIGMPIALGQKLYESLPEVKDLVKVEGAAHAANLMKPDVVNAAIRSFLETHVYSG